MWLKLLFFHNRLIDLLFTYSSNFGYYLNFGPCFLVTDLSVVPCFIVLEQFENCVVHSITLCCTDYRAIFLYFLISETKFCSCFRHLNSSLFGFLCLLYSKYFGLSNFKIFLFFIFLDCFPSSFQIGFSFFLSLAVKPLDSLFSDIRISSERCPGCWSSQSFPVHLF